MATAHRPWDGPPVAATQAPRRANVAQINLELCFRELSAADRRQLLDRHFEAVGMSFVEMGIGWFTPIERLLERVAVHGREHLDRALARGRGVLLFGAHFTTIEVGVAVLEKLASRVSCMYRPQRNAMMDVMIRRGRHRFAKEQIPRDNVRALLRSLRDNYAVCYLPDQTYLGKQSELLPFFGEPAVTNTATSKLASISGATVLPYFFRRLPNGDYRVDIGAPLDDFPSASARATRSGCSACSKTTFGSRPSNTSGSTRSSRAARRRSPTYTRADERATQRSRLAPARRRGAAVNSEHRRP